MRNTEMMGKTLFNLSHGQSVLILPKEDWLGGTCFMIMQKNIEFLQDVQMSGGGAEALLDCFCAGIWNPSETAMGRAGSAKGEAHSCLWKESPVNNKLMAFPDPSSLLFLQPDTPTHHMPALVGVYSS